MQRRRSLREYQELHAWLGLAAEQISAAIGDGFRTRKSSAERASPRVARGGVHAGGLRDFSALRQSRSRLHQYSVAFLLVGLPDEPERRNATRLAHSRTQRVAFLAKPSNCGP